jgi:hypothetical protein
MELKKFESIVKSAVESGLLTPVDDFTQIQWLGRKDLSKEFRVVDKEEGEFFVNRQQLVHLLMIGE